MSWTRRRHRCRSRFALRSRWSWSAIGYDRAQGRAPPAEAASNPTLDLDARPRTVVLSACDEFVGRKVVVVSAQAVRTLARPRLGVGPDHAPRPRGQSGSWRRSMARRCVARGSERHRLYAVIEFGRVQLAERHRSDRLPETVRGYPCPFRRSIGRIHLEPGVKHRPSGKAGPVTGSRTCPCGRHRRRWSGSYGLAVLSAA